MALQRIGRTGDALDDQKLALERLVARKVGALDAQNGPDFGPQGGDPNNPTPLDSADQSVFTTGYSGGVTTLAFTWDISLWDSTEDRWTA